MLPCRVHPQENATHCLLRNGRRNGSALDHPKVTTWFPPKIESVDVYASPTHDRPRAEKFAHRNARPIPPLLCKNAGAIWPSHGSRRAPPRARSFRRPATKCNPTANFHLVIAGAERADRWQTRALCQCPEVAALHLRNGFDDRLRYP